jgi:hypothetical protein
MLLLVQKEVLGASHDTRILNTLDRLRDSDTCQYGIGAEALPVSTAFGDAAEWSCNRAELYIDTFAAVFGSHGSTTALEKSRTPCRCDIDAYRILVLPSRRHFRTQELTSRKRRHLISYQTSAPIPQKPTSAQTYQTGCPTANPACTIPGIQVWEQTPYYQHTAHSSTPPQS